jgi:hypothetical protein
MVREILPHQPTRLRPIVVIDFHGRVFFEMVAAALEE